MRTRWLVAAIVSLPTSRCVRAVTPTHADALDVPVATSDASAPPARDATTAPPDASVDTPLPLTPTPLQPYASCVPTGPTDAAAHPPDDAAPARLLADDATITPAECATPISGTLDGGVTLARRADGGLPCRDAASDACVRHVYAFTLTERALVDTRFETDFGGNTVSIRAHCDDPTAVPPSARASVSDTAQGMNEWVLAAGTWFVESEATSGATVSLSFARRPSNYGCDTPEPVAFCTPIDPPGTGELFSWQGCDPPDDGLIQRFVSYRVEMPADSVLHVAGAEVMSVGCGPISPGSLAAYLGPYDAGPLTVGIARSSGPFYFEAIPAAPNRVCASAARLSPGTSPVQNTGAAGSVRGIRCLRTSSLYYVADLPAHTATRFMAHGSSLSVDVATSCEALDAPGSLHAARVANDGDAATQAIVRVMSSNGSGGSTFTLSMDPLARADAAPNSFCESPVELRDGDPPLRQDLSRAYGTCAECFGGAQLAALYYRVNIPAHHAGRVFVPNVGYVYGPLRCGEPPDGGVPIDPIEADGGGTGYPLANDSDSDAEIEFAIVVPNYPDASLAPFEIQWIDGG